MTKKLDRFDSKKFIVEVIRTPQFHILPKIHNPDIPARPVVSYTSHTSKISNIVEHYLQPYAKVLPSYIKHQIVLDCINKISRTENITKDRFLVTFDVKSLYTNISNHEVMKTQKEVLNSLNDCNSKPIATKIIVRFLLILTFNDFIFNEFHDLQKMGCTMVTICAPNYATEFERTYKQTHVKPFVKFYYQFIDDLIVKMKLERILGF